MPGRIRNIQRKHAAPARPGDTDRDCVPTGAQPCVGDPWTAVHEKPMRIFRQREFIEILECRVWYEGKQLLAAATTE